MRVITVTHACGHIRTYRKHRPVSDLDYRSLRQWEMRERDSICRSCLTEIRSKRDTQNQP